MDALLVVIEELTRMDAQDLRDSHDDFGGSWMATGLVEDDRLLRTADLDSELSASQAGGFSCCSDAGAR
jgi:hypothetical protein